MGVNEKMKAIADAIRHKTKGTEPLTLDGMATEIPKVFEEGKQAEYDAFWNAYQENGNRTNYDRAFAGIGWNDIIFKPKYKINVVGSAYMTFAATHITEITRETVDFSKATKFSYTFYYHNRLEKIEVDVSSATAFSDLFYNSNASADRDKYGNLADVKLFNINEKCTFTRPFPTPFPKLTNFFVSGVIGSDFDIKNLTLISKDNIINVINCLSTKTSGLTVTLSAAAVNKAFETAEGLKDGTTSAEWIALAGNETTDGIRPNWTISLV